MTNVSLCSYKKKKLLNNWILKLLNSGERASVFLFFGVQCRNQSIVNTKLKQDLC